MNLKKANQQRLKRLKDAKLFLEVHLKDWKKRSNKAKANNKKEIANILDLLIEQCKLALEDVERQIKTFEG